MMTEKRILIVVFCLIFIENVWGSFCGENALPYSFEISSSNNLILGCAKPNCLGWANKQGAPSRFYNVNGEIDGFVRELRNFQSFTDVTAECEEDYTSTKCIDDGEWIGGIKPNNNISAHEKLLFRCCKHSDIKFAKFLSAYDLKENEKYEGGEIFDAETGEQLFFDYINNIVKFITDKGITTYEVFINRLPCIPLKTSNRILESNITVYNTKKLDTTKLFQAPTFIAANELLPLVDGGSSIPMQGANLPPPSLGAENSELATLNNVAPNTQLLQPPTQNIQPLPPANNFQPAPIQPYQPMMSLPFIPNMNPVAPSGTGQSSYYYPVNTNTAGSNPFLCGFWCFTGDTLVTTLDGNKKRLDELEIDEWVLSSGGNVSIGYSRVNSWIHRMPKVEAEFIKFTLEDGKELKITDKHYIYRGDCSQANSVVQASDALTDMVYAEEIKLTDCLFVKKDQNLIETKISKIEKIKEIGIYAPMTESGNIVVNDILASCYNIEKSSRIQSTLSTLINENNHWGSLLIDIFVNDGNLLKNNNNEIDLIPGLQTIISIVKYILPQTNIY